jgi:surface protein
MPTVNDTDQTFVALHAIHPSGQNFCAFKFTTSSGQYRVDWGDGTITLYNSDEAAEHDYNYGTYDTNNTTLSTRGYKQAIIVVTPVSGNLLTCDFSIRYTTTPAQNLQYATGFLDCILSMPNANTGQSIRFVRTQGSQSNRVKHAYLERIKILTIGGATNMSNVFTDCPSLQSVPLFDTSNVTNMGGLSQGMFERCTSLKSVPLFDTSSVTSMLSMFDSCTSLQSVPLFNTSNVTNIGRMFANCTSLKSVPLFDTSNVTNISSMFQNCSSLQSVPLFDTSNVTNINSMFVNCTSLKSVPLFDTSSVNDMNSMFLGSGVISVPHFDTSSVTNMAAMFQNCFLLQSVPLFNTHIVTNMIVMFENCHTIKEIPAFNTSSNNNTFGNFARLCKSLTLTNMVFNRTVSFNFSQLSKDALVNIFNNLTDLTSLTTQNINISGTWGASALTSTDRDIALNKNWTITG